MSSLTINASEEVLQRLRMEAASRHLSVSRYVGELVKEKFMIHDAYEEAMADFFSRSAYLSPPKREDGRDWPTREELYDRKVLR
ncbi:MAG: hypothetical protein LBF93_04125 [Zoogloeaceae bacterium]|jgi:hypothetical protein|nr:hypothetical protein [Zoogloeaceae bacterium]